MLKLSKNSEFNASTLSSISIMKQKPGKTVLTDPLISPLCRPWGHRDVKVTYDPTAFGPCGTPHVQGHHTYYCIIKK